MTETEKPDGGLHTRLNLETSRIAWKELLRFFAAGAVIAVGEELDLVEAAAEIANDNAAQIERWMAQGKIGKVSDAQAKTWLEADAALWAVIVKPWILVQQTKK